MSEQRRADWEILEASWYVISWVWLGRCTVGDQVLSRSNKLDLKSLRNDIWWLDPEFSKIWEVIDKKESFSVYSTKEALVFMQITVDTKISHTSLV